jgi:hypothetical protein
MKGIDHKIILLKAFRTAIIFGAAFIIYEFLNELEKLWLLEDPNSKTVHYVKKKFIKFILVFLIDLALLYFAYFLTGRYL